MSALDDVQQSLERGDHQAVVRLTDALLAERPGNDAAHEYRARALLALGRLSEAERHAQDAVRLDPEEIRYRELLAQILSARGAHRDAAAEFARLARNDPRESSWTVAEAQERLGAAQPAMGVEPHNGRAQLALAQALARTGDARGAFQAATRATELLPNDTGAREALADAHWLADEDAAAFAEFRALANELQGADRHRVVAKARAMYHQHAGMVGRLVARIGPAFNLAFSHGWLRVDR